MTRKSISYIEALQRDVQRLELEVAEYKRRELVWKERWQRIAYNIRQSGMQVHNIDRPVDNVVTKISLQEANN